MKQKILPVFLRLMDRDSNISMSKVHCFFPDAAVVCWWETVINTVSQKAQYFTLVQKKGSIAGFCLLCACDEEGSQSGIILLSGE